MTDQIIPFNFDGEQVRVVTVDGEPWFVLADLCAALDLPQVSRVKARLDDALTLITPIADSLGRTQNATIVSEAGMYEVVIRSDKPEAATFRRWITNTVLPSIRKTGSYGTPAALTEDEVIHQALQITSRKIKELEAKAAEDAPKVGYVDTFVADGDLLLLRTVAKSLGMQEKDLRNQLEARGWIYKDTASRWSASINQKVYTHRYSAFSHKTAYFTPVPNHEAPRFRGEVMHTLKVTPLGAEAIARNFKQVAA